MAQNKTKKVWRCKQSYGACNWCGAVKWLPAHFIGDTVPPVVWGCDHH